MKTTTDLKEIQVNEETEVAVKDFALKTLKPEIPPHMKQGYPQAICIGIPEDIRKAAVIKVANEFKEVLQDDINPELINEYKRIKYNFRSSDMKQSNID